MNLEDDILIERYLKNDLSNDEKTAFINRMEADVDFKNQVGLEQQMLGSLNETSWSFIESERDKQVKHYESLLSSKELTNLRQTISNVKEDYNNSSTKGNFKRWIMYSSAAVIALFFSIYILNQQENSTQQLYEEYINLNNMPSLVTRGDDNELSKAQQLFEEASYEEALRVFENTPVVNNANLIIYKGVAQMQLEEYKAAETTFNSLIESDFLDAEKGYWYKALLYLKMDDIENAQSLLKEIVTNTYYNNEKAKQLLKDL